MTSLLFPAKSPSTLVLRRAPGTVALTANLTAGEWAMPPPETIDPGATIQFGSVSTSWVGGTEGCVEYALAHDSAALASIRFANPFGFWNKEGTTFESKKPVLIRGKSVRRAHPKGYILEIKANIGVTGQQAAVVESPALLRSRANSAPSGVEVDETSLSWRESVTSALRGMFVTVINSTDVTLHLASHDIGTGSRWAQRPNAELAPSGRDTFGSLSRCMDGTSGTVAWTIDGCEKAVVLIWDNPYYGPNQYTAQCPDQFRFVLRSKDASCSGIVFILTRKITGIPGLLRNDEANVALEEVEDMDWARMMLMSPAKMLLPDASHRVTFKIFSAPCYLLPPPLPSSLGDPQRRAKLLGAALERSPYDVLCLQECFWVNARQTLRNSLYKQFPHIVDRAGKEAYGVGVGSGLFLASKHPILWSQFFPFEEGIGSDSLASKGVLVVKLHLQTIAPAVKSPYLYVAMTDLQSDPDDSIPWKIVPNSKAKASQVRLGQLQMIGRMLRQQIPEKESTDGGSLDGVGVVLAGRLHMAAERRVRNEQLKWATDELIPHLADLLNSQKIPVVYASELMEELKTRGFQNKFLGPLRAATLDRRSRSLLLVVMVCHVLQHELWMTMREKLFEDAKAEADHYILLSLAYYEALMGVEYLSEGKSSEQKDVMVVPQDINNDNNASPVQAAAKSADSEIGSGVVPSRTRLVENIWCTELEERILREFGGHSISESEAALGPTFLKAQVLWFQLVRYMQHLLGVKLTPEAEVDLLENGVRKLVFPKDVSEHLEGRLPIAKRESVTPSTAEKDVLQVEQSPEFVEALVALGKPRDAFREANTSDFGSDVSTALGQVLGIEEARKDLVLFFDQLPGTPTIPLTKLKALSASRVPMHGDSGAMTDTLTGAPAVECVFEFLDWSSAEEDFTML